MGQAARARISKVEADESPANISAPLSLAASRGRDEAGSTPNLTPAVPVMTGTHFHALDEKGRVIIPAKLRPALTEQFWLMVDDSDNVVIYNYQTGMDVLAHCENMIADNPGDEDIAAAVERTTGAAELVSVEGNWRVQLSPLLLFHAGLDKEIVTVGVLNHAVMWSREKWENAQVRRLQSTEVRRAQGEMLRAAASSTRKKAHEQAKQIEAEKIEREEEVEEFVVVKRSSRNLGNNGIGNADVDASGRPVKTVAPASDGRRSPRVLTLSQLGR